MNRYQTISRRRNPYRKERTYLTARRWIHASIILFLLLSPVWYNAYVRANTPEPQPLPKLKLVSDDVTVEDEHEGEYLSYCYCEITLTFDQPVSAGRATVSFYDKKDKPIETKTVSLSPDYFDSEKATATVFVDGLVKRYEIKSYDFEPYVAPEDNSEKIIFWIAYCTFLLFFLGLTPLWIQNFTCKCREYIVGNHQILVYAGHRTYLKVDGRKYDEAVVKSIFATASDLHAVLDNGAVLDVTVTHITRYIRFKVDGRMISPN